MASDSRLLGFGGMVGAAALGAAIAAAPAALRVEGGAGACGPVGTWALLVAVAIVPMGLAVFALRRARVGFAAGGRPAWNGGASTGNGSIAPLLTLLLWLVATFASMTVLGALFRARTHHRALGGVVFAGVALAVALLLALVSVRVAAIAQRLPRSVRWGLGAALGAGVGFLIAVARAHMAEPPAPPLPPPESARLVDGLAFLLAALLAARSPAALRRSLALVGPPFAVIILVLGVSTLRACPPLKATIEEQAPFFGSLVGLLAPH